MTLEEIQKKYGGSVTPENIVSQYGGKFTSKDEKMPLLTKDTGKTGTAVKDVAVGAGKGLVRGGRDLASLAQEGGKGLLGLFGVDTSQMGIKSIDDSTSEGAQVTEQLKSKSRGEQVGGILENVAEVGTGLATKVGKTAIKKGGELLSKAGKKISENRLSNQLTKVADITGDVADKQKRLDTLRVTGKTNKAGTPAGAKKNFITGEVTRFNTTKDMDRARDVAEFVKSKNPLTNIANLNKGAEDIAENVVLPNLRANPRIFNTNTLRSKLDSTEIPLAFKADPVMENTYGLIKDTMMKVVNRYPKTMEGLWNARKEFDRLAEKEFGDLAFTDPKRNLVKRALQDVRRNVNDFIADEIGDGVFRQNMRKLSNIYESVDNIAETNWKIMGTNRFQRLLKKYPTTLKILFGGTAIAGLGKLIENSASAEE